MDMLSSKSARPVAPQSRRTRWLWPTLALITALLAMWLPRSEQRATASSEVTWSSLPSMLDARQQATATLLKTGQVLVAGGLQGNTVLSSAALFDPTTSSWTSTSSMAASRYGAMAALLNDGRVLVAGGVTSSGAPISSAEVYDPAHGTWSGAGTMIHPRHHATATLLNVVSRDFGDVLIVGGYDGQTDRNDAELYNPSNNTWTELSSSMKSARSHHTATVLGDGTGRVLIAAGLASNTQLAQPDSVYDPSTETFNSTGNQVTSRYDHTATWIPSPGCGASGCVLLAGGYASTGGGNTAPTTGAELYDVSTGKFRSTGSMLTPRAGLVATQLGDGTVLVAGGVTNTSSTPTEKAELYTPSSGTWSQAAPMGYARAYGTGTLLCSASPPTFAPCSDPFLAAPFLAAGGTGFLAGGTSSQALSSTELYGSLGGTCATCGGGPGGGATATPLPTGTPAPTSTPVPLSVAGVQPANGQQLAALVNSVVIQFSRALDPTTATAANIFLTYVSTAGVTISVTATAACSSGSGGCTEVTLTPAAGLLISTSYILTIKGGSSGIKDVLGTTLPSDYTSTFTTSVWSCSSTTDTDADGIPDVCETGGLTYYPCGTSTCPQKLDLPAMGANPNHKDIFVQLDWMADSGCASPPPTTCHNQQLSYSALQKVMTAFNSSPVSNPDGTTGIHLHIDEGPNSYCTPIGAWTCTISGTATTSTTATWGSLSAAGPIPWQSTLGSTAVVNSQQFYDWTAFDTVKNTTIPSGQPASFAHSGRSSVFHFALAAYNQGGSTSSGLSRGIPTSDFMVTLGSFYGGYGTINQQAGTFMHELGHNLGLHHGGTDDNNNKPNFLSVMNYLFQMSGLTKTVNSVSTNGNFDYSEIPSSLPSLNENSLTESAGLGSAASGFGTSHYCKTSNSFVAVSNAASSIDWNCSGAIDTSSVSYDTNNDGLLESTLAPASDWSNFVYTGGLVGHGDAQTLPMQTLSDELTPQQAQLIANGVPVDVDPGSCPNSLSKSGSPSQFNVSIVSYPASGDTPAFDGRQLDLSTVKLEGVSPLSSPPTRLDDEAKPYAPYIGKPVQSTACTTGLDGIPDETMTFSTSSVIAALGTVRVGDVRVLHLTANLTTGQAVQGEDVVTIGK